MRRCSSKTELQLLHPTSIKLQRKHHGKDSTKTVQPQEKQGQSWRATRSDGAVEWKSFSLNKQRRDGSHNHREAVAGGCGGGVTHLSSGGQALIMRTEGSSHQGVNWETSAICPQRPNDPGPDDVDPERCAKPDVPTNARRCFHQICLCVCGKPVRGWGMLCVLLGSTHNVQI